MPNYLYQFLVKIDDNQITIERVVQNDVDSAAADKHVMDQVLQQLMNAGPEKKISITLLRKGLL